MVQRRRFLVGSSLLLAGCGGATVRPLELWTMQLKPEHTTLLTQTLAEFTRLNPELGAVTWVDVPWADMEKKILSAVAAGTAPDVVNLNPPFAVKLAQRQALLDVAAQVTPQEQARYFPNLWRANSLNGVTFGFPWYVSTQVTIYNQALLQKAGIKAPPRTYAEVQAMAQTLKTKTGKYAFLPTFDTSQILEAWVKSGVQLRNEQGKAGFDSPLGLQAAQFWVGLYQDGLVPRETLTEGHRKSIELYQAGEIALLLTGPQFLSSIQKNAPQIAQVTRVAPQLSGANPRTNASAMNMVIPKGTAQPEAAVKLALFLTNDRNQLALAKAGNLLPSTQQAAQDPFFTKQAPDVATQGRLVSARQLQNAEVLIPPFDNLDKLQQFLYEELQQAMLGQKSPALALKAAAEKWNDLTT